MTRLALLAFAAACVALSASASASPAVGGPGKPTVTLNYLEIQTNFAATISQNQRPKLGDRFWFHSDFYKWNGTKRGAHIGHADVSAVFLPSNVAEIVAVGYLPGGTLTVVGESSNQRVNTLSVVGGTGRYATARGEIITRSIGRSNSSADTIRLWM
jgi:Dirigent-like protein